MRLGWLFIGDLSGHNNVVAAVDAVEVLEEVLADEEVVFFKLQLVDLSILKDGFVNSLVINIIRADVWLVHLVEEFAAVALRWVAQVGDPAAQPAAFHQVEGVVDSSGVLLQPVVVLQLLFMSYLNV